MRTFRTARRARVAEPPDEAGTTTPVSRSEHSARSASRVLEAEQHIRVQIAEMLRRGALGVGHAAVLDPGIESRGAGWHAEDDQEHEDYLREIDLQIAEAQERVTAAGGTHRTAEEHLDRARQDYREARRRLGADPLTPLGAAGSTHVSRPRRPCNRGVRTSRRAPPPRRASRAVVPVASATIPTRGSSSAESASTWW